MVTVRSDGTDDLDITGVVFRGEAKDRLSADENCVEPILHEQDECSITVRVKPGKAGHAQMRIQQNLKGPASIVEIDVDEISSDPDLDLTLSAADLRCAVVPDDPFWQADGLTIFVRVRKTGAGQLEQLVPFTLRSDTGLDGGGSTAVGTGPTGMQLALRQSDYHQSLRFTLTLDPDNEIVESDESNNSLDVIVDLPDPPDQAIDVACSVP